MDLTEKPKAGLYIDDSNLYHRGKATGWLTDYKKLYKWVSKENVIVHARIFMGIPRHEPAKSISGAMEKFFKDNGFKVTSKKLKRLKTSDSRNDVKNKCNFDIEMHDEIMKDLNDIDFVYIASGDSDFLRTKENILKEKKHIKFIAYKRNCAWEIMKSWFIALDNIRNEVERGKSH